MSKFDLGDYIEVKDRIPLFYAAHPNGSLMTGEVRLFELADGPYIAVQAFAYRSPEDLHPGVGWSWMKVPGSTTYTKNSELENTETSAWGRAIASLNIGIGKSIASANEVRAKSEVAADVAKGDDGSLIGIAEVGTQQSSDMQLRTDAELGPVIGFRLRGERGGILVQTSGQLAVDVARNRDRIIGKRVTCWGSIRTESFKKGNKTIEYQVLAATKVRAPEIPDMPGVADEPHEAPSESLGFDDLEALGA